MELWWLVSSLNVAVEDTANNEDPDKDAVANKNAVADPLLIIQRSRRLQPSSNQFSSSHATSMISWVSV